MDRVCQYCGARPYVVDFQARGNFVFDAICHRHYNLLTTLMHANEAFAVSQSLETILGKLTAKNPDYMSYASFSQMQSYGLGYSVALAQCHLALAKFDQEHSDLAVVEAAKDALTK